MGAHLSAEFLANDFELGAVYALNAHDIGDKSGIQLDGEPGRQIDSEMIMSDQHDAVARQNLHQGLTDKFSIGVSKGFVRNLPHLSVRIANSVANGIEFSPQPVTIAVGEAAGSIFCAQLLPTRLRNRQPLPPCARCRQRCEPLFQSSFGFQ